MLSSPFRRIFGVPDDRQARIIELLRALGIATITYSLNGSGDSGDCELEDVSYANGTSKTRLPEIAIGFSAPGNIQMLSSFLEGVASDLPEGDWINNGGGHGTVTIAPFEVDPADRFVADMTYREDYDDEDDVFEDLEFEDESETDAFPEIRIKEGEQ